MILPVRLAANSMQDLSHLRGVFNSMESAELKSQVLGLFVPQPGPAAWAPFQAGWLLCPWGMGVAHDSHVWTMLSSELEEAFRTGRKLQV